MVSTRRSIVLALSMAATLTPAVAYNLSRDYSGQHFFDGWDYYGSWDNLTLSEFIFTCLLPLFRLGPAPIVGAGGVFCFSV